METDAITIITRINLHVLPLFILYMVLRSRLVYRMLTHEITQRQALLIVSFALAAIEAIHWNNPLQEVMLMSTAVMRIGILAGLLFGRHTGLAIGFGGGSLALLQEPHGMTLKLTVLVLATLCGFLAGQYKTRYGAVWENSRRALGVAMVLFTAALVAANSVLLLTEPKAIFWQEVSISVWKVGSFGILVFLIQNFIKERHNINSYDVLAGEMLFARRLQMDIVAHKADGDVDPRARVFGVLYPAKDVGGDWYDYFMLGEDKLCLIIGDVSGKGVPAALFMVVGCMLFRAFRDETVAANPAALLEWVNNDLCENNQAKMFITAVCAILDLKTGELTYCNVGHTKAYIKKTEGPIVELPVTNKGVLGFFNNKKYSNLTVQLQPRDIFLTYTDGVTEAQDTEEELFGNGRLETLLSSSRGTAKRICETILKAVNDFSAGNEQSDDITLLAVEYGKIEWQE
ncbi:MAG TPA: PP2C family protein-serine/threonine phosphatase [Patescibacteria group bacterium]|nr:PP2C family protein-serine/threonine phosphatase [Patescibacteria group bacterium]